MVDECILIVWTKTKNLCWRLVGQVVKRLLLVVLHQPFHILPVNDVHKRVVIQRRDAMLRITDENGNGKVIQMIPFGHLRWPGIAGDTQGSYDESFGNDEFSQY